LAVKSLNWKVLENWDQGKLNQNVFGNAEQGVSLPADVQLRLQSNAL
tara:strand:+ start:223 stop:363 length:141 start_codon:yes stop_codon:yes gene_type:complete